MTNWKDLPVQFACGHAVLLAINLSSGIYLWEFLVTLKFDWECVRRIRPFRWTLVLYFTARYACLVTTISAAVATNVFSPIGSCTDWWRVNYIGAHASVASASLLLVIRVVAISERNKFIAGFLGSLWLAALGTQIYSLSLIKGIYIPELLACGVENTVVSRLNVLVSFAVHLACLILVIVLLLRTRGGNLWRVLLSQGVIYFAVIFIAYTSTSILLLLDLNDSMNLVLQIPTLAALVICAGRMYRGLVIYAGKTQTDGFTMTSTRLDWRSRTKSRVVLSTLVHSSPAGQEPQEAATTVEESSECPKAQREFDV